MSFHPGWGGGGGGGWYGPVEMQTKDDQNHRDKKISWAKNCLTIESTIHSVLLTGQQINLLAFGDKMSDLNPVLLLKR